MPSSHAANGQIESEDSEHGKRTICGNWGCLACLRLQLRVATPKFDSFISHVGEADVNQKSNEAPKPLIKISIDDYESLPSYMKGLALWEVSICPWTFFSDLSMLVSHAYSLSFFLLKKKKLWARKVQQYTLDHSNGGWKTKLGLGWNAFNDIVGTGLFSYVVL